MDFMQHSVCSNHHIRRISSPPTHWPQSWAIALGIVGLFISRSPFSYNPISEKWGLGFTTLSKVNILSIGAPGKGMSNIAFAILLANLPQCLISLLNLFYNNVITSLATADEWNRFAYHQKTLRITSPTGDQCSIHHLQLPYKYGVLLLACAFITHFLISQSVYFVRVAVYDVDDKHVPQDDFSATATAYILLLLVLLFGSMAVTFNIVSEFCLQSSGLPLAGCCSAVIAWRAIVSTRTPICRFDR